MNLHRDNQYMPSMPEENRRRWEHVVLTKEPEVMNVAELNAAVKILREELYWKNLKIQELETALEKAARHT